MADSDRAYTMGRSKEETERLIQQSGLYEDITLRLLRDAGLFTGMKVLDIGSGAGDVALAAAEIVGDKGEVIGVDMNQEILQTARTWAAEAGLGNVDFVSVDVEALDLGDRRLRRGYRTAGIDLLAESNLATCLRPGALCCIQTQGLSFF